MKVVVCGSRGWTDVQRMREILELLPEGAIIIHGGAPGADRMAGSLTRKFLDLQGPIVYPADWRRYGNDAGPIRNRAMLDEEKPDLVIAFWDGQSPGTRGMMRETRLRGIELWEVRSNGETIAGREEER